MLATRPRNSPLGESLSCPPPASAYPQGMPIDQPDPPSCAHCNEPMKLVRIIPQFGRFPELFAFHCERCNHAETIEKERGV
jgi:hypothetical protein